MPKYTPIIGLEIHTQLSTRTKLFCSCPRVVSDEKKDSSANTAICPICLGLPGAMPLINEEAIEKAIRIGLALNCTVNTLSVWDRKNYMYPDLFNGYQISQLDYPLNYDGYVDISNKRIKVERAHLENDAAKSLHEGENTLLNANKSGAPLVEIVSGPDLRSAEEAKEYAEKVREIVRWIDSSNADMYLGEMRFDINISLCVEGDIDKDGIKNIKHTPIVEVKNRNSFKEIMDVVEYEIKRQTEEFDLNKLYYTKGSKVTRGWDEAKGKTFIQRQKEEADEYRYCHEPDVSPLQLKNELIERIRASMPKPINEVIDEISSKNNINKSVISYLVNDKDKYNFYLKCLEIDNKYSKNYINWISTELEGILKSLSKSFENTIITPRTFVDIIIATAEGIISNSIGKDILKECIEKNLNPNISEYIKSKGLGKVSDSDAIRPILEKAFIDNAKVVEEIKNGKDSAKMFFVGIVMREMKGKADANAIKKLIEEMIK